jgi:hypothetical protein
MRQDSGAPQRAVVVAVVAVRVVQVAVDQVVDVVAVRHRFVAAAGSMHMTGLVATAPVARCAGGRVGGADLDHMFIDMAFVQVVQVAVVQVVDMVTVAYRDMATARAVHVVVWVVVRVVAAHGSPSIGWGGAG